MNKQDPKKKKLTSTQQRALAKKSKVETTGKVDRSFENKDKRLKSEAAIRKSDTEAKERIKKYKKKINLKKSS